ncbi:MAG TPA: alpha/beta hydrolase [Rickettsiales bacterium]|nr:alpha/beta hydrolase [Rickettsiales bacterium]
MKKQILCLSGWGQKFDSLEVIFDDKKFVDFHATSLDYSNLNSVEEFFSSLKNFQFAEIIIGWSLGGQLAIRAIANGLLNPKYLILIAPPFQMIKDARVQEGMDSNIFNEFYENLKKAPNDTLKQFTILMAMNDKNATEIARCLDVSDKNFSQLIFWLEELARFSCFDIDFSKMPKTLYFHGEGDMIVNISQMNYFKNHIKNFHGEVFKNCGHAPQLSDLGRLREIILREINIKS